jgi:hypothetical protein
MVLCAYGATLLFAPLSWASVAAWAGLTGASLTWSAAVQPQVTARAMLAISSALRFTRRSPQGQ